MLTRFIFGLVSSLIFSSQLFAEELCTAYRETAMVPTDKALCESLRETVRHPSALRLDKYEEALNQFFKNWCHRDEEAGWVSDKYVREVGSYTTRFSNGEWKNNQYYGFHAPVVIWYSPEAFEWIKENRSHKEADVSNEPPVPDGAMIIKEMMDSPSTVCRQQEVTHLYPENGAAIMIRDSAAAHDGWFWGYYGWPTEDAPFKPDWPPSASNSIPNMGFGAYCMNCHASAANHLTFSSAANIKGQPGQPIAYLTQDFNLLQSFDDSPAKTRLVPLEKTQHEQIAADDSAQDTQPLKKITPAKRPFAFSHLMNKDIDTEAIIMPSQTYDNVWMKGGEVNYHGQYLTSDQCLGCHDAGSTGLQFDMTTSDPEGDTLLNFSPYATWRTSPMGLAGRDPIFFAQMASETQTFHSDSVDLVETTCLGCHGILGQRQFQIDHYQENQECQNFSRSIVNATPLDDPEHANYGALARDGISCTSCHHMVLGKEDSDKYRDDVANKCVSVRQDTLNPDNTGFAKTFTGSFFVGPADKIYGPFSDPREKPMQHALGVTPEHNTRIQTSEICGTCHNVHLPVLKDGQTLGHIYEQTTYSEWAFSDYRSGQGVDGPLPGGQGSKWAECQFCHTPNQTDNGTLYKSRIASIQENTNFPEAEFVLPPSEIDVPVREGFAKHTLVGLNLFLTEMFDQYPDILGVATQDPMLVSKGLDPIQLTKREMIKNAKEKTADIAITNTGWDAANQEFTAAISITNHVGHKFPSGVGFRRAFVHFEVLDADNNVIWQSGRPNDAGVIVDDHDMPLAGELWWNDDCTPISDAAERPHQPHYQTITQQTQAQIYQELVSTPPTEGIPNCSHHAEPEGYLTTSFLSICAEVKDNRLLPSGFLPLDQRIAIAEAQGAGKDLADDADSTAVDGDPDYVNGGGDNFTYAVNLQEGQVPVSARATLYYQAIPPFYLQDRFCTAKGTDRDRLLYLVNSVDLGPTAVKGWKLQVGETATAQVGGE